ncbi:MAG TPA: hypothetical protein VGR21_07640 [Cryptosporangiaceae bacterium]|nr:hypothetical protein [Cryptosporangiaceae bacterium]
MGWIWRYRDHAGGSAGDGASEEFPSQSDAESWLGENWRDLLAAGVTSVVLEEDGREEYAMPLTAE